LANKPKRNERLIVVADKPGKRFSEALLRLAFLVTVLVGITWYFQRVSRDNVEVVGQLKDMVVNQARGVEEILEENRALRQEVIQLTDINRVDGEALEQLRQMVKVLEEEKLQLQQDIRFYRSVLGQDQQSPGLSFKRFDLKPTADPQQYRFRLVVIQSAGAARPFKGSLALWLTGRQGGQAKRIAFKTLSADLDRDEIKLGFRYFQNIPGPDDRFGVLNLPDGFVPEYVEAIVLSPEHQSTRFEKKFPPPSEDRNENPTQGETQGTVH
jgi:hypothetical protein